MVKKSVLSTLDPATGKLLKRARLGKGTAEVYASPIGADGKVYIATVDGRIAVLGAGPDWEIRAVNDLGDEIHATPAAADGRLYVRTRSKLFSFAASSAAALRTDSVSRPQS